MQVRSTLMAAGGIGNDELDDDKDAKSSEYNVPPNKGATVVHRMSRYVVRLGIRCQRALGLLSSLQREPTTLAVVSMPRMGGGVRTEGSFNQIRVQSYSIWLVGRCALSRPTSCTSRCRNCKQIPIFLAARCVVGKDVGSGIVPEIVIVVALPV